MKKNTLLFFAFFVIINAMVISCGKVVNVPVSYTLETPNHAALNNIYIADSGIYTLPVLVQFLSGYAQDSVTIAVTGLPGDISITPNSYSAIPTYTENFALYTNHAAHGTYNVTITATANREVAQTYNFTVTVVASDCASAFLGTLTAHNACSVASSFGYTVVASSTGTPDQLSINNFGGYGSNTNATVYLNCDNDSLTIPSQNIGNGTTLSGYGTYSSSGMVIYYNAARTPTGGTDVCTATFTR